MSNLNQIREEIDEIDGNIAKLLQKRFELTEQVALYKADQDIPVYNKEREEHVFLHIDGHCTQYNKQIYAVYEAILRLSRRLQYKTFSDKGLLTKSKISCEGKILPNGKQVSMALTLSREFKALIDALALFADNNLTMHDIRLHPLSANDYLVCMEIDADANDRDAIEILCQLSLEKPDTFRVLSWE